MDPNYSTPAAPQPAVSSEMNPSQGEGCLSEMGWMASGLVLPLTSTGFYRLATRRRTILGNPVFLVVGCLVSLLITAGLSRGLGGVTAEIQRAYAQGKIPPITIQNGEASVNAPQPLVLIDSSDTAVIIDTTGQVTELDANRYRTGLLLTRTELQFMSEGSRYQRVPLSTINQMFSANPLIIDQNTVSSWWQGFSILFSVLAFFGVLLWTTVIRLGYIVLLALPVWGIVSLIRSNTPFNPILITGLYASIPAMYTVYLLQQVRVTFLFLGTIVLLFFWLIVLVLLFRSAADRPPQNFAEIRPWRALIGIPLLILFVVNMLFPLPNGAMILWIAALLTVIALAAVTFWPRSEPVGSSLQ